ncbi:MAG: hypothetical protein BLM47_00010 [Candidatus Reconcilbacillus cellulovorans]|uniref:Uncharacterized protein n=1 Tax=Candidatus Reconcilbacillus cellulovorans TaxID=1906605 RepID=A0A2A6E3F1_9BACL|nr:MAG: hypothetical protein BLM47_00010 [Candidatus Reconcilbacillus cellulovorans]
MNEGFSLTQFEAGKEIMSKQLHDNALDVLIDYLKENELLCITPSIEIEKFVLCKSTFKIVDLEYLENITKREFHDILGFDKKEVNKVKRVNFSINEFTKILKFTSEILPSRTFIKQENFILPLKKEYLREQPKEIIFKYNEKSEVNMLGRVTRKINIACETNPVSENVENFFSVTTIISEVINMFLESSGIIKNGDYVVSPVAIFFEST